MNRWGLAAGATCLALSSGCAVGPEFQVPVAPSTGRFTAHPLEQPQAESQSSETPAQRFAEGKDIPGDWWTLFRCDVLNGLVARSLAASPNLEAANAALRAANEDTLAQQGAFYPSAEVQLNPTRQSVAPILASPLASGSNSYALHTAQVNVSYVPDAFGLNRRQVESLAALAAAQKYQLEAAQLSLTANVVLAAIQEASLQAQIIATHELIDLSSKQLDLVRREQESGQIGAADTTAQEAALAQVQATLAPLQKQSLQQRNQLAVLMGGLPSETLIPDIELDTLHLPDELPVSVPSALVRQRPDVRAAEEQLHSASAQIGVAIANRLPNFTLTASAGSASEQFSRLFRPGTGFWGIGANLVQPIFDGNALLHRQRAAQAAYEQSAALYRAAVLVAFQNVADALEAIQSDAKALGAQLSAERAAERSLKIARLQRSAGMSGSLSVLIAEQAYRQARLARIQAQSARVADSVALFLALGGGWWHSELE
jgi:NodT family efflux transporter outer membrane factor (OMF) lipoprotein